MDLGTYEEFADKLDKKPAKDLYKIAREANVLLPPGLGDTELILRALYDALKTSDPSAAKGKPSAPSSDVQGPAADGPRIKVLATHGPHYYRCNRKFKPEWQTFLVSEFTLNELDTLRADPHLRVKDVKEPEPITKAT
jgi:hypothetical protein